ncbi:beta-1,3-glucan-binding protein-like [Nylanderia fulva]|uniref:beta-1,3-glucan-binding protein-like n=1 Tax=Nylanderia fulva TaxID=613905 RepID=UPI0010FB14A8|nr:beta-1,3-glucan-binding protein-like [Nylanderia fulva]
MERSLVAKSFLLAIFLVNIHEYRAYTPPAAKVEPLHPTGLRISIPDEHGITLVAFHVKFNEDFDGLEAGHIARDILKVRNQRWTYQDRQTQLKRDDIIYYWVHVVYQGLGYNLIDQSFRVVDFYNSDGTKYNSDTGEQSCTTTSTTWIFENGERRQTCPRQLLFEDNFDNLNTTNWNSIQRFAGAPDYEFVVYMTNDVTDVTDGRLRIKPILLDTKFGTDYTSRGRLILEGCTGQVGSNECQRQAAGSYILPPLISGRLNTKGKFEFLFGRVEVRAKLPRGDWVYPLITLESAENTWEFGLHREIRIASSVGNDELKTSSNENINNRLLSAGGLTASLNESNAQSINLSKMPKRQSSKSWSDEFHIFEIEWQTGLIVVKVDGVQYGEQTMDGSFSKPSYLTLAVAVGGIHEFADHVTSAGNVKPWRNVEAKAMYKFYRAKDNWYPTWNSQTGLQVDYVKIWAL